MSRDLTLFLGQPVAVTINRPLGSRRPTSSGNMPLDPRNFFALCMSHLVAGALSFHSARPYIIQRDSHLEDQMPKTPRFFVRRPFFTLLVSALLLLALTAGCGSHHSYYHTGYAPAPVIVVHHYGSGYGGYGGPNVVHVHHYGGGGGFGRRTVVIHHYR